MGKMWEDEDSDFDGNDAPRDKTEVPNGTHSAHVDKIYEDEDAGTVDVKLYYRKFNNSLYKKFWLVDEDPIKRKKKRVYATMQLEKLGFKVSNAASLRAAFQGLLDKDILTEVKTAKNPQYKDVSFLSLVKDTEPTVDGAIFDASEIPFMLILGVVLPGLLAYLA